MLRVYCDSGAMPRELKVLEAAGRVALFQFLYENWNRKIKNKAVPSRPSWKQLNYKTWKHLDGLTWDDLNRVSTLRPRIESLLGPNCKVDAQHLDSAYMSKCDVFLTSDKDDIASRAVQLEELLGLKVFHVTADWDRFVAFLEKHSDA